MYVLLWFLAVLFFLVSLFVLGITHDDAGRKERISRKERIIGSTLAAFFIAFSFYFGSQFTTLSRKNNAEAMSNEICITTLNKALSEYRADFGTDAVVALSETDRIVPELTKEHVTEDGRKVGPYLYEATLIEQCSAKKWRIRPITATTLHIDLIDDNAQ